MWLPARCRGGLPTRRERTRPRQGVPLVRTPRTLPRVLEPAEVDALTAALRTHRDQAMVAAMVLGGLRRCEVLGLRLIDVRAGDRRLFIADCKGGRQRLIPVSGRFFTELAAYPDAERPAGASADRVVVVLKGPRRGQPLSAEGLDEIMDGARQRAGLAHATCHQLRHLIPPVNEQVVEELRPNWTRVAPRASSCCSASSASSTRMSRCNCCG
jgi:site-specific recombinase XerD